VSLAFMNGKELNFLFTPSLGLFEYRKSHNGTLLNVVLSQ
jgi:hypothetical protein